MAPSPASPPPPIAELPLPALPPRAAETHKGSYGTVLVVSGSRRYPGAAILAALGAGRAGAGLVQLALPDGLADTVLPAVPFATLLRCEATDDGGLSARSAAAILEVAAKADAVVAGPGLGTHADTGALLQALLAGLRLPLLLDADALNLLARPSGLARPGGPAARGGAPAQGGPAARLAACSASSRMPIVLTPHPGEFARLAEACGWSASEARPTSPAERLAAAARFARESRSIVVLKGHGSVVTDGRRARVETAGNPGMARGGMGDVLSGAAGALLARVPSALPDAAGAVALAVHAHAVAGDLAARELGEESMLPEDVARLLGRALATPR
jgi:ADP-dependent NAD(P)H-hydrate dehydratase